MKKIFTFSLFLIVLLSLVGCRSKVKWWVNGVGLSNDYEVLEFRSGYEVLEIPDEYKGHPIVSINFGRKLHVQNDTKKLIIGKNIKNTHEINGANLEEIVVNEENQYLTAINGVLYSKDLSILYSYPRNKQGKSLIIIESVESLLNNIVNTNLEEIYIYSEKITDWDYSFIISTTNIGNKKRVYVKESIYNSFQEYVESNSLDVEVFIIEE